MSDSTRPQIIMTSEQAGARLLAEEMVEMKKHPLDRAKQPGGVFARADGTLQNAHGEVIAVRGAKSAPKESEPVDYEAMSRDELQALAEQRNLAVKATGASGAVKADYVKALEAADKK